MKSEVSPEDHPVFLQADDLLAVRFRFLFISDASKGVGKAIAFSGIVVDEYVSAGTIMPTHRMNHRPPKVANGVKTLTKIADPEYAMEPPDKSIIEQPELALYYEGFGDGSADNCLVAEEDGKVVGAVWTRIMNDYGHLDNDTPSFAISLYKRYRGRGYGTVMMRSMLDLLKEQGYEKASLAVQKSNYAVRLYEKVGFRKVSENSEEFIMVCDLGGLACCQACSLIRSRRI